MLAGSASGPSGAAFDAGFTGVPSSPGRVVAARLYFTFAGNGSSGGGVSLEEPPQLASVTKKSAAPAVARRCTGER